MVEHHHGDVFVRRGERLIVAPSHGQARLLGDLARAMERPYRVEYELLVPFGELGEAVYVLRDGAEIDEVVRLLGEHEELFERDARGHLRVVSQVDGAWLQYDQHDWIEGAGPIDLWERMAIENGLRPGDPALPIPHTHHYHEELDGRFKALLEKGA